MTTHVSTFPRFAAVAAGILIASLLACDVGSFETGPPATCTESGAQCQLADGPLGVCERSPCAAGEASPCFRCTPQH